MQILKENLLTIQCMSNFDDLNQSQSENSLYNQEHQVSNILGKIYFDMQEKKEQPINKRINWLQQLLSDPEISLPIPIEKMYQLYQRYKLLDDANNHQKYKDLKELLTNIMEIDIQSKDLKKIQKESQSQEQYEQENIKLNEMSLSFEKIEKKMQTVISVLNPKSDLDDSIVEDYVQLNSF